MRIGTHSLVANSPSLEDVELNATESKRTLGERVGNELSIRSDELVFTIEGMAVPTEREWYREGRLSAARYEGHDSVHHFDSRSGGPVPYIKLFEEIGPTFAAEFPIKWIIVGDPIPERSTRSC